MLKLVLAHENIADGFHCGWEIVVDSAITDGKKFPANKLDRFVILGGKEVGDFSFKSLFDSLCQEIDDR